MKLKEKIHTCLSRLTKTFWFKVHRNFFLWYMFRFYTIILWIIKLQHHCSTAKSTMKANRTIKCKKKLQDLHVMQRLLWLLLMFMEIIFCARIDQVVINSRNMFEFYGQCDLNKFFSKQIFCVLHLVSRFYLTIVSICTIYASFILSNLLPTV